MRYLILILLFSLSCEAQIAPAIGPNRNVEHPGLELTLDHYIGVVIAGQSNAYGTNLSTPSTSPVDLTAPITDVFIQVSLNNFATLDYPSNDKGDQEGSNLAFGYYLRQAFNRPVYMDVVGVSGAPVAAEAGRQDFNVSTRELYVDLLNSFKGVRDKIILEDRTPFLVLVWIQGERDTNTSAMADAYDDNLRDMVNSLIADGIDLKAIIVHRINSSIVGPGQAEINKVRLRAGEYVDQKPYAWVREMNAYTLGADGIHYDGPAQEQLGIDNVNLLNGTIITDVENVDISFADVIANMASPPPAAYQTAMENLYNGLVSDGDWDDILEIQYGGLDTEANSLRGWKGFYNATNHGATHIPKLGFDCDGTADYIDTGFNPSLAPRGLFGKFDGGIAIYCNDNQTATGIRALFGISDPTPDRISMFQNSNVTYRINCSGSGASTAETSFADNSLYSTYRTASNLQFLYKNGASVQSNNSVTTDRPDINLYEGAINSSGTATNFFDGVISMLIIYKGTTLNQSNLNTRVQAFITEIAAIP